ncbi:MAG: dehydrogenase [Leptospiraceae bacterium]|nr:MAG: dehydrogenase [Leptospiraceae bacterium]
MKKIVYFILILGILNCQFFKDKIIDLFTPEYKAEPSEFKAQFIGPDKHRKKILLNLITVFSGKPQITSIRPIPDNPHLYLATIKTGELMLYNFKNKNSTLIKKFDVLTASEQGLLGLAFHPNFNTNRLIYLHYSIGKRGKKYGRISEFYFDKNFQLKNERILLEVEQPYANHDGGHLEFGPDGYLYIGLGDGGWRDDPHNHGQNPKTLLGAMLRIDVKPSKNLPYSIPEDNPYKQYSDWRKEIYAIGLRNPWKYCFDPLSGKLIVADVGQDQYEEISIVEKGKNYGWRIKEGYVCYMDKHLCNKKELVDPIYVYTHEEGQSITGGYVYTSNKIPELKNKYIFGDFVQGKIWAIDVNKLDQNVQENDVYSLGKWPILISTFGYTKEGEILIGDYQSGKIYMFAK